MGYQFQKPYANLAMLHNDIKNVSLTISYVPDNFYSNALVHPNVEQLKAAEELCHEALRKINELLKEGENS